MALTQQQIQTLTLQAKARGYDADTTQRFLEFADGQLAAQPSRVVPKVEVPQVEKPKGALPSFLKKIGSAIISNEVGVGQSLAAGIIPHLGEVKDAQSADQASYEGLQQIAQRIREKKARGEDASKLVEYYRTASKQPNAFNYEEINPASTKSNRQALGEVAGVGLDILTAGTYGKAATASMKTGQLAGKALPSAIQKTASTIAQTGGKSVFQGAMAGAKAGAKAAAPIGAAYGFIEGVKDDNAGIGGIALDTIKGGAFGALFGGTIGAASGAASQLLQNRADLKQQAMKILEERAKQSGDEATSSAFAATNAATEKYAKEAVSKGIEPKYVDILKTSTQADKKVMQKMYKTAERASKDLRVTDRPIEDVGETFLQRINVLKNARTKVGSELGDTVRNLPNTAVAVDDIYTNFTKELADASVTIKNGKLNFADSAFANDAAAQRLFQQTFNDLKPTRAGASLLKPAKIDIIRKRLFNDLDLAGKGGNATSTNAERILGGVRTNLGEVLGNINPKYTELSQQYAQINDVLGRFNSIMGKDYKMGSATSNLKAGEIMRRLLSNASARPTQLVVDADTLARTYNPKITGDVRTQVLFADMLEDLFGIAQKTSLAGQVQKANEQTLKAGIGVAEDVANRNLGNLLYKGVIYANNKLRGISPEAQQEVVRKLIGLSQNTTDDAGKIAGSTGGNVVKDFFKGMSDGTPGLTTKNVGVKQIDSFTKREMVDAIDYLRLNKPYSQKQEEFIGKLAEKYGITATTPAAIANQLEKLVSTTKTGTLPRAAKIVTEKLPAMTDAQYADDAAALLKASEPVKKGMSLADEAAALSKKTGIQERLFNKEQTQYESLINGGKFEDALRLAVNLPAKTPQEESMKKSLINMAARYIEENNPNAAKIIGKITGGLLTAGAAIMGARKNKKKLPSFNR